MFHISGPRTEDIEIEILPGVTFTVRPFTALVQQAALSRAAARVRDMKRTWEDAAGMGADVSSLPDFEDADVRAGLFELEYAKGLACQVIKGWTGIAAQGSDDPAPATRETILAIMDMPGIAALFRRAYEAQLADLDAEKNGFAPAPNGTSAAGRTGAAPVTTQNGTAPAPTAPTG